MKLDELPFLGALFEFGERDQVFDALMILGPLLIIVIGIFGRSPVTVALAAGYILALLAYVGYKAVSKAQST